MSKEYNNRFFKPLPVKSTPDPVQVELGPVAKPHPKEYLRRADAPLVETDQSLFDLATAAGPASQGQSETQPNL